MNVWKQFWKWLTSRRHKIDDEDIKTYPLTPITREDLPEWVRQKFDEFAVEARLDFDAVVVEKYDDWAETIMGVSMWTTEPDGTQIPMIGRTVKKRRSDGKTFLVSEFHKATPDPK